MQLYEQIDGEEWLPVVGYEERYEVSNLGRVKRLNKRSPHKVLDSYITRLGYLRVGMTKNGVLKQYFVHRIVALAFIKNSENKPFVNHIDNNKINNRVENLEWCTQKENMRHAFVTGNLGYGEKSPRPKLTVKDVLEIRASNLSLKVLARKYGVLACAISDVKRRKTWPHV